MVLGSKDGFVTASSSDPTMNELPTELRFPNPPFRLAQSVLDDPPPGEVLSNYLGEIRQWRSAVLAFLEEPEVKRAATIEGLSERASEALATCLSSQWPENMSAWAKQSPYNLNPFPAPALEAVSPPSLALVLDVLRWRACVMDMLSDIWDVIGEPWLDLDECMAMEQFLYPVGDRRCCAFCLTEFASDQMHVDQHQCLILSHVRAKWPEFPPAMKRWAGEAREVGKPVPAEATKRRRWWQFWK